MLKGRPHVLKVDKLLADYLQQLKDIAEEQAENATTLLQGINHEITEFLLAVAPAMGFYFDRLEKSSDAGLWNTFSDDHKLMTLAWDPMYDEPGTNYINVVAYKVGRRVLSSVLPLVGSGHGYAGYDAFPVKDKDKVVTYIMIGDGSGPGNMPAQQVFAMRITDGLLTPVSFFRRGEVVTDALEYRYDIRSVPDDAKVADLPRAHWSKDRQKLYFPLFLGPQEDQVTKQYHIYVFDGYQFVYDHIGDKDPDFDW